MDTATPATNVGGADVTAATTAATTTTQGKGSLLAYTGFHPVPPLPLASTISTYMHREDQHSWSHTHPVLNPTTTAASASNQNNNGGGGLNNNKRKHEALEGEPAASSSLLVPPVTGATTATAVGAGVAGAGAGEAVANADDKRGRNTIVIHPGSRWLRIGRASDILPVSVPHVIARWTKNPKRPVVFKCGVRRPTPLRPDEEDEPLLQQQQQDALLQEGEEEEDGEGEDEMEQDGGGDDDDEEDNEDGSKRKKGKGDAMEKSEGEDGDAEEEGGRGAAQAAAGEGDDAAEEKIDEGTARIDGLKAAFKDRLKIYQYRYQKGAAESAVNFNRAQTKKKNGGAETIADHNDLQRITWITSSSTTTNTTTNTGGSTTGTDGAKKTTAFFGHDVFLLSDSVMKDYEARWPLRGMRFNCDKREDVQGVLNDLVDIWTAALVNELEIKRSQFKTMSAVLVVPDLADRIYIKELVQLLL
ncbi:actin-like protein arp8, partial [Serendipita sp. 399]